MGTGVFELPEDGLPDVLLLLKGLALRGASERTEACCDRGPGGGGGARAAVADILVVMGERGGGGGDEEDR